MSILGYKQKTGSKIWHIIPELTREQVFNATKPTENGQTDGSENRPPADSTQHAETEHQIAYEAANYLKEVNDRASKEFADIAREASSLSLTDVDDDFEDLQLEADKSFNHYSVKMLPELKRLRVEERRELRDLKLFKERNRLDRLAKYPDSHVLHIALVALCLLGESMANMWYFSAASNWGILGGLLQAIGITATNVFVSFAVGLLALRYINHVHKVKAILATCCFGVYLGVITTAHFLVAHYRDLLLIDPENALLATWDKFRAGPFHFESMDSGFVLLIGLVVAIVALVKGYTYTDAYPQYGKKDRDYRKKAEHLHKAETAVREVLVEAIADAEAKINKRLADYEQRHKQLVDRYEGSVAVVEHFDNIYLQVDDIVRSAINTYREANLRIRTDGPPRSFNGMPIVERLLDKDRFAAKLEELRTTKEDSAATLSRLRQRSTEIIRNLASKSESMGQTIDSFTAEVHHQAQQQITQDDQEV